MYADLLWVSIRHSVRSGGGEFGRLVEAATGGGRYTEGPQGDRDAGLSVCRGAGCTAAAIYINLAEHLARMECGTELAATTFGPSYRRATVMQVTLALTATIGGIGA